MLNMQNENLTNFTSVHNIKKAKKRHCTALNCICSKNKFFAENGSKAEKGDVLNAVRLQWIEFHFLTVHSESVIFF